MDDSRMGLRVALIADIPVAGHGGVEVLVRELASGLSEHAVVFLVSPDGCSGLEAIGLMPHISGFCELPSEGDGSRRAGVLAKWLRDLQVSLCHFHLGGTFGFRVGSGKHSIIPGITSAGIRCLTTNHQFDTPFDAHRSGEALACRIFGHLKRMPGKIRQLRAVDREVLVSKHDLALSRRWFPHCQRKFAQIYHSRLDQEAIPPGLPDSLVILNLASIAFRKGQHVLAEAFAKVAHEFPDWTLHLVGMPLQEECLHRVREIASDAGLADRILLPGPSDDPAGVIARAEIYVQPSLLEGLGLSLQEAQFAGRASIGSRVGGIPELITDGKSGLLVPPADPDALAEALARLMRDRTERERFGSAARAEIRERGMTRQGMIGRYLGIYREILAK